MIETFKFTKEVPLADADGKPIREGSVLMEVGGTERGVVVEIVRPGQWCRVPMGSIGDIEIKTRPGISRITNRYSSWRHIPQKDQTYEERYLSWIRRDYDHDDTRSISKDEGCAIDGIMALLPDDTVEWEYGPWPDKLEDALEFLVAHLTALNQKIGDQHQ